MDLSVNNVLKSNCNKQSFKGSVDKSLLNYLKEVKADVINTKGSCSVYEGARPIPANIDATKNLISEILPKLHEFMSKTHPDTKLVLKSNCTGKVRDLYFKNTKLNAEIKGFKSWSGNLGNGEVSPSGVGVKRPERIKEREVISFIFSSQTQPHNILGLKDLAEWTKSLVTYINPKKVDNAIFNKMVQSMESDAENLTLYGKFKTKRNIKKANEFAEEFGEKPIYKEKFEKIAREKQFSDEKNLTQQDEVNTKIQELEDLEIK